MKIFIEKRKRWRAKRAGLEPQHLDKIWTLLHIKDQSQISSTFQLLESYDNDALCELLCVYHGQIMLRGDIEIHHPLIWLCCILDEINGKSHKSPLLQKEFPTGTHSFSIELNGSIHKGNITVSKSDKARYCWDFKKEKEC